MLPLITISGATETDLPLLQRISRDTFSAAFAHQNTEANMQHYLAHNLSAEKLLAELQTPGSTFYLAQQANHTVGYLKLNQGQAQTDLQHQPGLEIERIYILPEYYGLKAGQQLLDFALAYARKHRFPFVWLGVWEHNQRAIRFYQKNGFAEFARHPFILGSEEQTDLLMRRQLQEEK